jgi:hypothetical protein
MRANRAVRPHAGFNPSYCGGFALHDAGGKDRIGHDDGFPYFNQWYRGRMGLSSTISPCKGFAYDTAGKVDDPPNYGEEVLPIYAAQAAAKHKNGAPMFAPDGTMLDDKGNRSIFDDLAF